MNLAAPLAYASNLRTAQGCSAGIANTCTHSHTHMHTHTQELDRMEALIRKELPEVMHVDLEIL